MRRYLINGIIALALSGCSLAPEFQRPQMVIPQGWSSGIGTAGISSQEETKTYWRELGSDELNRVVETALAQNLDLEAALHRIEQARAQAKVAGSPLYPSIDASVGTARNYQDIKNTTAARGLGSISYEVDLWGKNRNQLVAANYRANATQYDRAALQLIIVADTITFYTQVLSLSERIRIAENNLKNAEEVLRITEARFREGSISGLEVSQQRVAVNNIRAALTLLTEQRSTNLNALAIWPGRPFFPRSHWAPTRASRRDLAARQPRGPPLRRISWRRSLPAAGLPGIWKTSRRDRRNWRRCIRRRC